MKIFIPVLSVLFFSALFRFSPAMSEEDPPSPLVFEAEDYSQPSSFSVNKLTDHTWNLWRTDKDAVKKWSKGVVLQSPPVLKDRTSPEEGAPPLHTVIKGIPNGRYDVEVKLSRALAVSRDGKTWEKITRGNLGTWDIKDGIFELWVDDRFASEDKPGSSYYDCLIFYPISKKIVKPLVKGSAQEIYADKPDRGLVAVNKTDGNVYLSWRLLDTDLLGTSFNLYRADDTAEIRLNKEPLVQTTDFKDTIPLGSTNILYYVRPVHNGIQGQTSSKAVYDPFLYRGDPSYRKISLRDGGTFQKVAVADLDGDGSYDFIIKKPDVNVDPAEGANYWKKSTGTYTIEAYRNDGKFLWSYDLGWSIEEGMWYSPYIVYDFDGDGKAEVAVKTGEGDPRDSDGHVTKGAEYLTILDGLTGREKTRVNWPSREGFSNYNFYCRNQLGIAYLDGKTPCIIAERGTYNTIKLVAYEYRSGNLRELWKWNDREDGQLFRGQGAHMMHAADIDGDGRDELVIGSAVVDDNGNGLWSTGLGHPDQVTVGDLDPLHPGLEIAYGLEMPQSKNGLCMADAKTGKILWGINEPTKHVHSQGLCADIDPAHPGCELYGGERDDKNKRWILSSTGQLIAQTDLMGLSPKAAYWDADYQRELIIKSQILKYGKSGSIGKIEGNVVAVADVEGDWREEIITSRNGELRIYTTTIPSNDRRVTLMQDHIYRNDVVGASQGYYQIPAMLTYPK
jgi:rhamnogalacturonan endolyase